MTQNELYETITDLKNRSAYSPNSLFFSADVLKNLDEKKRKDLEELFIKDYDNSKPNHHNCNCFDIATGKHDGPEYQDGQPGVEPFNSEKFKHLKDCQPQGFYFNGSSLSLEWNPPHSCSLCSNDIDCGYGEDFEDGTILDELDHKTKLNHLVFYWNEPEDEYEREWRNKKYGYDNNIYVEGGEFVDKIHDIDSVHKTDIEKNTRLEILLRMIQNKQSIKRGKIALVVIDPHLFTSQERKTYQYEINFFDHEFELDEYLQNRYRQFFIDLEINEQEKEISFNGSFPIDNPTDELIELGYLKRV